MRDVLQEREFDHPSRAVALFGHDHLSHAPVGAVPVVQLVAVQEANDVGVCLERPRFSQVGQVRALVCPGLQAPAERTESKNGHPKLAGEDLQAAADGRHLNLAVLRPGAGV